MKNRILISECNDIKFLRDAVISLCQIIDDIDTCGDMAKHNDRFFRNLVEAKQAERWNLGITSDGYNLYIPNDSENIEDAISGQEG